MIEYTSWEAIYFPGFEPVTHNASNLTIVPRLILVKYNIKSKFSIYFICLTDMGAWGLCPIYPTTTWKRPNEAMNHPKKLFLTETQMRDPIVFLIVFQSWNLQFPKGVMD